MKRATQATIAMLVLLLAGCASSPSIEAPPGVAARAEVEARWLQRQANLSAMSAWRLKGKMAIKAGRKGGSATLIWDYQRDREEIFDGNGEESAETTSEEITLYGPFGGGRMQISARPGHAVLTSAQGKIIEATSVAQALRIKLGWQVPFQQLRRWVRGLADDSATGLEWDAAGRLVRFRQGDWRVEYIAYRVVAHDAVSHASGHSIELPRQLSITALPGSIKMHANDGAYLGDQLSVKIIIKRWQNIKFTSPFIE